MSNYPSTNKLTGILLIAILLISGCNTNVEKSKSDLQKKYIRSIIGSQCNEAQKAHDEMVKIDPADKFPLRTYVDQDLKKMDKQIVQDINEGAEYASKRLEEIQEHQAKHRNMFNKDAYDYYHADDIPEATEDLREGLSEYEAYRYQDQRPINYQSLKTYVNYCKTGDKLKIPVKDLRKALELK